MVLNLDRKGKEHPFVAPHQLCTGTNPKELLVDTSRHVNYGEP